MKSCRVHSWRRRGVDWLVAIGVIVGVQSVLGADVVDRNWPSWRGPRSNGTSPEAAPPITWSETNHVVWKVEVPGRGSSTPIVWEDQVFLVSAIPDAGGEGPAGASQGTGVPGPAVGGRGGGGGGGGGSGGGTNREGAFRAMVEKPSAPQRFVVIAYDRATGRVRWERTVRTELPHESHHKDHGYASASPTTDGEVLVASFGSRGVHGLDLQGKVLWSRDFGRMKTRNGFGEASSPTLHGDRVFVVWDHEGEDFIVALDKRSGKELWRQAREEPTGWSTPVVVEHEGRKQVVVNGTNRVRGYDYETGALLWQAGGQTTNAIPTVVAGHGLVFAASGLRGSALYAIRLGRSGELTGTDGIAWSLKRATPYVPSPLLYDDLLYFYSGNNAQLSIYDAKTGVARVEAERLEGLFGVYASPTAAAGRVYLVGRDGATWVIKHGPTIEVLAKNRLDDGFDASPALAGRQLFLRGRQNLYCLTAPPDGR